MNATEQNTRALENLARKIDDLTATLNTFAVKLAQIETKVNFQDKLIYGCVGVIITMVLNAVLKGLVL